MKAEKFTGTVVDQLEMTFAHLLAHRSHFLMFSLLDLKNGAIRCSSCKYDVVSGSREFIELLWLEWSMSQSD